ncbi:PIN domain-containing protein [Bradyrhizobium sp. 131]|uniref:PIN domain-containing protein n=1 Tax=Bradyrhizobium sp. 131 TaxID=2782609 RepID=UPI001FFF5154|nr:PIN domain-containing protein [Bradyrhizobium sp. 131]UPK19150.1 PIN domain-containing protein [Bradyrhizobium sp. 131]
MSAFVDSTVWFAAAAQRDRNNELAKSILSSTDGWVLTDHVLAETWQLLRAHFGAKVADKFWEGLRHTGARVATLTADDLKAAWHIQIGEEASFVDSTSLAFMERNKIDRAATFNPHFAEYRYGRDRNKRFQIVRTGHSTAFRMLKDAILQRRPVRLSYGGTQQTVCPYILGHAGGEERAFALALDGAQQRNKSEQGAWICLRVVNVQEIEILDQPWAEQGYPGRVQRCVDQVHLDAMRLPGVYS